MVCYLLKKLWPELLALKRLAWWKARGWAKIATQTFSLMSEEQLKAFLEKVKGDTTLQDKLKAAADVEGVIAIAKEAGFMISADELKKAQSEISEDELESVSGGACRRGVLSFWTDIVRC